ncbi:MAG: hypothetical protein B6U87_00925 [Candidatus Aenigmarchaeota archaeon ex4484_52]|nr:MAG: hypothetical protein B6U87_00925 [Candidatus Aenigmarchaeota archaeon ex4484_52]
MNLQQVLITIIELKKENQELRKLCEELQKQLKKYINPHTHQNNSLKNPRTKRTKEKRIP